MKSEEMRKQINNWKQFLIESTSDNKTFKITNNKFQLFLDDILVSESGYENKPTRRMV